METSPLIWGITITIIVILGLLATDYFFHIPKAHIPTLGELSLRSAISVGIALLFGVMIFPFAEASPEMNTSPATSPRSYYQSITSMSS